MRCWGWGVSGREWISAPTGLWRRLLRPPALTAHAIHALCEKEFKEYQEYQEFKNPLLWRLIGPKGPVECWAP
jgi:hypothetical protein